MNDCPLILKTDISPETISHDLGLNRKLVYQELKAVEKDVQLIIEKVMNEGDQAVKELTECYDLCRLTQFQVFPEEIERAWKQAGTDFQQIVMKIVERVRDFHQNQLEKSWWFNRGHSQLGEMVLPLTSVAAYIPGGRASYPSSVIMTVIPAQIAGVSNIVLLTPPNAQGKVSPDVLAVAHYLGIENVIRIGGAQAIAAVAFGTESIPQVDKVVGPGNIYVTVAKKLLCGLIGIDSLAGPSEVLIIADESCQPEWVAIDLLAQAEHDPLARSILLSPSASVLMETKKNINLLYPKNPFPFSKKVPISLYQVENLTTAFEISNTVAPEHIQICCKDSLRLLSMVQHAGAIFLGNWAPVALGDYGFGPNHVLPTLSGSRFSSPLSVRDFLKKSSYIFPQEGDPTLNYQDFANLAVREGLYYHQKSLLARMSE